jgi:hypothetical protein
LKPIIDENYGFCGFHGCNVVDCNFGKDKSLKKHDSSKELATKICVKHYCHFKGCGELKKTENTYGKLKYTDIIKTKKGYFCYRHICMVENCSKIVDKKEKKNYRSLCCQHKHYFNSFKMVCLCFSHGRLNMDLDIFEEDVFRNYDYGSSCVKTYFNNNELRSVYTECKTEKKIKFLLYYSFKKKDGLFGLFDRGLFFHFMNKYVCLYF